MKKSFSLHEAGKNDARVLDAIKHDVRKYVRRERKKLLPDGFDRWTFECRVGSEASTARPVALKETSRALDEAVAGGGASVYVEIIAAPAHGTEPGEPSL